jgi:hypothetical protein
VIVNRSDVAHDAVANGAAIAGHRTLHGILAHEMTHGLIRAHFGILADYRYPAELREGYCDYVARGGSISDGDVLKLQRSAPSAPALVYWAGRKKVAAALAANHGNVDATFANWRG